MVHPSAKYNSEDNLVWCQTFTSRVNETEEPFKDSLDYQWNPLSPLNPSNPPNPPNPLNLSNPSNILNPQNPSNLSNPPSLSSLHSCQIGVRIHRISVLIKFQASHCNFIKNETLTQVFSCVFAKFLRTPLLQNTSGRLPLYWNMTDYVLSERLQNTFKNSTICVLFRQNSIFGGSYSHEKPSNWSTAQIEKGTFFYKYSLNFQMFLIHLHISKLNSIINPQRRECFVQCCQVKCWLSILDTLFWRTYKICNPSSNTTLIFLRFSGSKVRILNIILLIQILSES